MSAIPSLGAIFLTAVAACSPVESDCTLEYRYGINITVVDSVSGLPPSQATLLATSGTFADSVGPWMPVGGQPLILPTAGERTGTYSVRIKSPGYVDWTREGIVVTANQCHVIEVKLTARLQKP